MDFTETAIIAHRGASFDAPENTMAAFRLAWEQGADGVEGDFRLTRDGRVVCFHDENLRRVAGRKGRIEELDLDEIRGLDAGSWKSLCWKGEKIPLFEEVAACIPPGKRFYIELKSGPDMIPVLKRLLEDVPRDPRQVVVMSFDEAVVREARRCLSLVTVFGLKSFKRTLSGGWSPSPDEVLASLKKCGADGLNSNVHSGMGEPFAGVIRAAGLQWHVWTVDSPRVAERFFRLGAGSVTTNRPAWLRQGLPNIGSFLSGG